MSRSFVITILIILSVTALLVLPHPGRRRILDGDPPREASTVAAFKIALNIFQVDCGRYPTTAEGLRALLKRPPMLPEGVKWLGPYVDKNDLPKDRWGHDYVYRCPGRHNQDQFDVFSCGPDGIPETADDIGNWTSPTR